MKFRTCTQCPRFSANTSGGNLDMKLMDNQEFITCDECQVSHVMQTVDLIGCWTDEVPDFSEDESETTPKLINMQQQTPTTRLGNLILNSA